MYREPGWEHKTGGIKMPFFRRLVMGIVELMAVLSIFFGTFVGGIYGAASGALFRGIASNVDINLQGIGQVDSNVVCCGA